MTPFEMAMECKRVIESEHNLKYVCLVVPGPPYGRRKRLIAQDRKSPLGEIANADESRSVCYFDAIEVLAYLAGRGLIKVDARVKESE